MRRRNREDGGLLFVAALNATRTGWKWALSPYIFAGGLLALIATGVTSIFVHHFPAEPLGLLLLLAGVGMSVAGALTFVSAYRKVAAKMARWDGSPVGYQLAAAEVWPLGFGGVDLASKLRAWDVEHEQTKEIVS